jgi:anti-anti-sigma regulatory factor
MPLGSVTIDLAECAFIDSTIIGAIVEHVQLLPPSGRL